MKFRAYHSCTTVNGEQWASVDHGSVDAVVCAGGVNTDTREKLDSIEVWYFKEYASNQDKFPWITLEGKLTEVLLFD